MDFRTTLRGVLREMRHGRPMAASRLIRDALSGKAPLALVPGWADKLRDVGRRLPGGAPAERSPMPAPDGEVLSLVHRSMAGERAYRLYVPAAPAAGPRPLVMMLHGCTQAPEDFARGTRMNAAAAEAGALVAWPEQTRTANPQGCWNWFLPEQRRRDAGEAAILAGILRDVVAVHRADPRRLFVAGLSAGGAMAAALADTHPELVAAVGVHSGLPAGAAHDLQSALAVMRDGAPPQPSRPGPRLIVFHGDADTVVNPVNAERLAATRGAAGDGARPRVVSGAAGGRGYTRTRVAGPDGVTRLEMWLVQGAGHAWSGGAAGGSHADPKGPDASREMLRFFLEAPAAPSG